MAKKKKNVKLRKGLSGKKSSNKLMDVVIGAILGNVVSKYISKMPLVENIKYSNILTPAALALGANYFKIPYGEGMVVGASVGAVTEAIKEFAPESISKLLKGEDQYVISGSESSDPLLGAQFLLGEERQDTMNPLDRDDYVISGASNDPLD